MAGRRKDVAFNQHLAELADRLREASSSAKKTPPKKPPKRVGVDIQDGIKKLMKPRKG